MSPACRACCSVTKPSTLPPSNCACDGSQPCGGSGTQSPPAGAAHGATGAPFESGFDICAESPSPGRPSISALALGAEHDRVGIDERGWRIRFAFQCEAEQGIVVLAHDEREDARFRDEIDHAREDATVRRREAEWVALSWRARKAERAEKRLP